MNQDWNNYKNFIKPNEYKIYMKISLWPYLKRAKNDIIREGIDNHRSLVFHNPTRVTEQFEFIEGDIREFIPSFSAAEQKFKNFEGTLHVFYRSDDKLSQKKVEEILKKHKIKYTLSNREYPV